MFNVSILSSRISWPIGSLNLAWIGYRKTSTLLWNIFSGWSSGVKLVQILPGAILHFMQMGSNSVRTMPTYRAVPVTLTIIILISHYFQYFVRAQINFSNSELEISEIKQNLENKFPCRTQSNKACIFPFIYKNKAYSSCTDADSVNGAAWCAIKVDSNGVVVNNKWEDCQSNCRRDTVADSNPGIILKFYPMTLGWSMA